MRIAITGQRGTLGRIVVPLLEARSHAVSGFPGDVRSVEALRAWLAGDRFDAVVHLAAIVPVEAVNADPAAAFLVNVGGTAALMSAIRQAGIRPDVFLASSSHVYAPRPGLIAETDPTGPGGTYGLSKWMAEQVVAASAAATGARCCIGRIFSFYDARQPASFLYPRLRERLAREDLARPFPLEGADDVRDLSPAARIAAMIVDVVEAGLEGTYNLGSGEGTRIADFARSLAPVPIEVVNTARRPATSLVADVRKLRAALGRVPPRETA